MAEKPHVIPKPPKPVKTDYSNPGGCHGGHPFAPVRPKPERKKYREHNSKDPC